MDRFIINLKFHKELSFVHKCVYIIIYRRNIEWNVEQGMLNTAEALLNSAFAPTCLTRLRGYVSLLHTCLPFFYVPYVPSFFTCLTCLHFNTCLNFYTCLTCPHFSMCLTCLDFFPCLTCLHSFMCITSFHFFKYFQFSTCLTCLHLFYKMWNNPEHRHCFNLLTRARFCYMF